MRRNALLPNLLATLFLFLLLPLAAGAGEGKRDHAAGHHHDPETRLLRLTEKLDLTNAQQDELRPILEQQAESFRTMRDQRKAGEAREQMRDAMRAQRENNDAQIEAVLDEQQVATYRELRAEHRARWKAERKKRHGKGAPGQGAPAQDAATPEPDDAQ